MENNKNFGKNNKITNDTQAPWQYPTVYSPG
jgi:hypothetical protein